MSDTHDVADGRGRGGANILLQTSPIASNTDAACAKLLGAGDEPPGRCLWVTYTQLADETLAAWRRHGSGELPAKTGIVAVGDRSRSPVASPNESAARSANTVVRTVADPTDLTGLGIELSNFFEAWSADGGAFRVCFRSITPLLTYVGVRRAYRFLHALTSRVEVTGATGYYHLTPDVHSARTVRKLTPLFDTVAECTTNDGVTKPIA